MAVWPLVLTVVSVCSPGPSGSAATRRIRRDLWTSLVILVFPGDTHWLRLPGGDTLAARTNGPSSRTSGCCPGEAVVEAPSQALQQTAAARLVSWRLLAHSAAAAAELSVRLLTPSSMAPSGWRPGEGVCSRVSRLPGVELGLTMTKYS